ncbi:uncharacterized protein [Halyomorpha halys]|uniref:uncharacterized protein n=1 Tax=Halyomorpha halys TaxID=286706 RepID=UPI0006D4CAD7|nr:uncharacterized protein LOC106692915 [Halyomorpha halys]XP_014294642.1 uncharacterized protein LOC106692915 [Halyomorpha halys]
MKRALVKSLSSMEADAKKFRDESTYNKPDTYLLFLALKQGANIDSIKRILYDIKDINIGYGYYSRSALHHAISWNCDLRIIEELISKGASISGRDKIGMTPLHLAVTSDKDLEYVPKLLALGADVNARSQSGTTPLYLAVSQFKKIDVINMLLEHGADTEYEYDDFWASIGFYTILEKAVVLGATSSIYLLIRTIFLKNYVNNFSKLFELMENHRMTLDLIRFMLWCIHELLLMQKTKISSIYSVFDITVGNYHYLNPLYTNADLSKLTYSELSKMFPIYYDVIKKNIALALQRGQIIHRLRDLQSYSISNTHDSEGREKVVILNSDCIEKICSYLTNQEILNFTRAFHFPL